MGLREIDVGSRGEVVAHLVQRHKDGKVKDCTHIRLENRSNGFMPKCDLKWASEEKDPKVLALMPGEFQTYEVSWPRCPPDCPHYEKAADFVKSAGRDQFDQQKTVNATTKHLPAKPLAYPEKITIDWLRAHVDMKFWIWLAGVGLAIFVAGIQAARIAPVRDFFGIVIQPPAPPQEPGQPKQAVAPVPSK